MESGAVRAFASLGDLGDSSLTAVLLSQSLSRALLAVKSPTTSLLKLQAVTALRPPLPVSALFPTRSSLRRRVHPFPQIQAFGYLRCTLTRSFDVDLLPNIASYNSVSLPFLPRTDGKYLRSMTQIAMPAGKFAKVFHLGVLMSLQADRTSPKIPIISGNQYDEGTILALGT
jgi:hypothetical protein